MTLREASRSRLLCEEVEPQYATGRVAGEFIYGYPPGIPLVMPGEVITEDTVRVLTRGDVHLMLGGGRTYKGLIPVLP
jgi:arginine/lysine/ornithine decarboxylase